MDVVTMESEAYRQLILKIENLENTFSTIIRKSTYPLSERWIDNQQACEVLCCSKRTLQAYRDENRLPFSQIVHKIYYKAEDIEKFLKKNFRPIRGF